LPVRRRGSVFVNLTLDVIRQCDMSKIYCDCGNIVSLDKASVRLKRALRKPVECNMCRNHRISEDIQYLNDLFDGTLDESIA